MRKINYCNNKISLLYLKYKRDDMMQEQEIPILDSEPQKSSSIFQEPFLIIINMVIYFFVALKFFFIDIWVALYNGASYTASKAYDGSKQAFITEEDRIYERTKKKVKKPRVYKYSARTLAKLEKQKEALLKDLQTAGATRSKEPHVYLYKIKEPSGKIATGTMDGFSKLDINAYLLNEGYEIYDIKTSPFIDFAFKDSSIFGKKMSTKDLIFWLTQLSTYIKAGLTLNEAIKILTTQMKGNKARTTAFKAISYELTLGESFSSALEKQGTMFPALLINMIKAAEASGTLVETLDDMASYYTEINETHKQMVSAMTYPAIITLFSFGVIIFILVYVVPKFIEIYDQNGAQIKGLTKIVIDTSAFLKEKWYIIILVIALIVIVFAVLYRSVKAFRTTMQMFLMHVPVIKNVIIYNELTIFSKTFASLLRNNVFITESMDILSRITNNEVYKAILYRTINNIVKGDKISEAFKDHWAVPDVAYYMIVTGESTGELAEMMQKVSDYYRLMHKNIVNNLKAFIEPLMISFLAIIVGGIIIAVIVPMFDMYAQIQNS